MTNKNLRHWCKWGLFASLVLSSVWFAIGEKYSSHTSEEWALSIASDIRADVLLGNEGQIEAKLQLARKEYGLAYLFFERTEPIRGPMSRQSEWQLAGNGDLALERYPVMVGGFQYGWLSYDKPTKGPYGLVIILGLCLAFFVAYVQPKLFPWGFLFTKKSPSHDEDEEIAEPLKLKTGAANHRLRIRYTAYHPVHCGDALLISPSLQSWDSSCPASLSVRELTTLAAASDLYRPAYKWLLVRALRKVAGRTGVNDSVHLLLPILDLQLFNSKFFDELKTLMLIEEIEPSRVILEIHESMVGQYTREYLGTVLDRFAKHGFGICVDGFGSTDKSQEMLNVGPITHVRWCVEPGHECKSGFCNEKIKALAHLVQMSGVRVIRSGLIDPASNHPLNAMVSWYSNEPPSSGGCEIPSTLNRQLLRVTYRDVYRHAL